MRKYILIIAVASTTIISSCGGGETSNLDQLKADRKDLEAQLDAIDEKIKALDTADVVEPKNVSLFTVNEGLFEQYFEIQGAVESEKNILVVPEVGGLISSLPVAEGQRVNKGEVIARINSSVVASNIQELDKQIDLALYMKDKQKSLWDKGVGTELAYKQALGQWETLTQTKKSIQTQQGKFVVKAPFGGFVEEVFPVEGEMAAPGMPIVRLVSLDEVSVKADIAETYLKDVDMGNVSEAYFPALDTTIKGLTVKRIGKFVNPVNRTITVEVDIPEPNAKMVPNLMSVIKIRKYVDSSAITVPSSIIRKELEEAFVYVLSDINKNYAVQKTVVLGSGMGDVTEILSGIKAGDVLVKDGLRGLNKKAELIKEK